MSGWRGGEQLTSWPLDRMADTSSILFHRTAECSSMRASCSGVTVEARGKGVRFDRELQGVGGYRGNSRDRDRSNARVRRGDYSRAASLTLTAPFVGSDSAGFELRHPIATRALVSYAPARWVLRIQHCHQNGGQAKSAQANFALYYFSLQPRARSDELDVAPDDGRHLRAQVVPLVSTPPSLRARRIPLAYGVRVSRPERPPRP